ncbi:MAG: beta-glucuronidase [Gaiellaceae bacterium]|nr:beta-glucuronidase [Gaiellaceae bacterium]
MERAPRLLGAGPRGRDTRSVLRPQTNAFRLAHDLSGLWGIRFDPDGVGHGEGWSAGVPDPTPIAVPGSWNDQLPGVRDELGPAWYELRFAAPPAGERELAWALRFGSVNYLGEVWLNGDPLGSHEGGHLPFAFPVAALREENVLVVRVDGRLAPDHVPPGLVPVEHRFAREFLPPVPYDFFPFAGIHRKVELVATPAGGIADVRVRTELDGGAAVLHVAVEHGAGELALALDGEPFTSPLRIEQPRLWSPGDPQLSRLAIELRRDGVAVDRYSLEVGLRTIAVEGERLLLNGEPLELRGFGRHEDFPVLGRGANAAVAARDLHLMRDLGANSFRTGHYPHDEETLDLADRLGLLVVAETPSVALFFAPEGLERRQELSRRYVEELVARDGNRACVVAWSVANEPHAHDAAGGAMLAELCDLARALDPTRPVTYASHAADDPGLHAVDFLSLNRYPAWYVLPGEIEAGIAGLASDLDAVHERHQKPSCSPSSAQMRCPARTPIRRRCGARSIRRRSSAASSTSSTSAPSSPAPTCGCSPTSPPPRRSTGRTRPTSRASSRGTGGPSWPRTS